MGLKTFLPLACIAFLSLFSENLAWTSRFDLTATTGDGNGAKGTSMKDLVSDALRVSSGMKSLVERFSGGGAVDPDDSDDIDEDIDRSIEWFDPLPLDPDAKKDVMDLISSQGYPVEKYVVQTQDGFLLNLHRIPYGHAPSNGRNRKSRPAIFLQHGLISSSTDWVLNFPNNSLGFILADQGYDVWMGDSRGNTYSRRHITLKPTDPKFWDWSFDEMAKYDTTAFIDFILAKTGQESLYYVGHSQGTIMAFALFASRPAYQKKVRMFVGLAPFISLQHVKTPVKYFFMSNEEMYNILGRKVIAPNNVLVKLLADTVCNAKETRWICFNMYSLNCGYDFNYFNRSRLNVYMNHAPAGSSVKSVLHYSQMYRKNTFAMFDYESPAENMKRYNQTSPPAYDISQVTVPSLLFGGTHDWLISVKDIDFLESSLSNHQATYIIPKWNHLDFVWALNAGTECYPKILEWLPKF